MNKRLIIIVSLVVILVLAVALVYIVTRNGNGPGAEIYVDPQTTVAGLGQKFTVNVRVSGASNLYGWELGLSWNSTLFDNVSVVEGSFFKGSGNTFFVPTVNVTGNYIFADDSLLGTRGVNGNGVLATIQFHVSSSGNCSLHLYDVTLYNQQQQLTVPTVQDGQFSTT